MHLRPLTSGVYTAEENYSFKFYNKVLIFQNKKITGDRYTYEIMEFI